MITNTQAYEASTQTYSKGTNKIAEDTLAIIKFITTSTNDPMVIIRVKGSTLQPSRNYSPGGSVSHNTKANCPPFSGYEERIYYDT